MKTKRFFQTAIAAMMICMTSCTSSDIDEMVPVQDQNMVEDTRNNSKEDGQEEGYNSGVDVNVDDSTNSYTYDITI